jgi:hypothetical protein
VFVRYNLASPGTKVVPVLSGPLKDRDGDTIPDALEIKLGSDPVLLSTRGDGISDSDHLVEGLKEVRLALISHQRGLSFGGTNTAGKTTFSRSSSPPPSPHSGGIPSWSALNPKLDGVSLPTTAPLGLPGFPSSIFLLASPSGVLEANGDADMFYAPGNSNPCIHAKLEHQRVWGVLSVDPPADTTRIVFKITRRTANEQGSPTLITTEVSTLHFTANNATSTDYLELKPSFSSGGTLANGESVSVTAHIIDIVPDLNMAGVLGDTIPSEKPGSIIKHFVTPKQLTGAADPAPLKLPDVLFKATGIEPAEFSKVLVWDGGSAGTAAHLHKVPRGAAGPPVVLRLKQKTNTGIVAEMQVWVVWATCVPAQVGTALFSQSPLNSSIAGALYEVPPTEGTAWKFKCQIQPAEIWDSSTTERPDLRGIRINTPPGFGNKFATNPGYGPADTAENKWDISRQMQVTIWNLQAIPQDMFIKDKYPKAYYDKQPLLVNTAVAWPTLTAEGNDDSAIDGSPDEDTNIHAAKSGSGLTHAKGEMSSFDSPKFLVSNRWGNEGRTFALDTNFREFARLELWDGHRNSGSYWFRISNFYEWHHYLRANWNTTDGAWKDMLPPSSSSSAAGHPFP